ERGRGHSLLHPNLDHGTRTQHVSFSCGGGDTGRSWRDGRDAVDHRIFGLAAYSVSKRMKELGIRIALGAKRKEVLQGISVQFETRKSSGTRSFCGFGSSHPLWGAVFHSAESRPGSVSLAHTGLISEHASGVRNRSPAGLREH